MGTVLVITKTRTDAVNFYNELLIKYSDNPGAVLRDDAAQTIASKVSKITVQAARNPKDFDQFRGQIFLKIFAVGFYTDDELEFLNQCIADRS